MSTCLLVPDKSRRAVSAGEPFKQTLAMLEEASFQTIRHATLKRPLRPVRDDVAEAGHALSTRRPILRSCPRMAKGEETSHCRRRSSASGLKMERRGETARSGQSSSRVVGESGKRARFRSPSPWPGPVMTRRQPGGAEGSGSRCRRRGPRLREASSDAQRTMPSASASIEKRVAHREGGDHSVSRRELDDDKARSPVLERKRGPALAGPLQNSNR